MDDCSSDCLIYLGEENTEICPYRTGIQRTSGGNDLYGIYLYDFGNLLE